VRTAGTLWAACLLVWPAAAFAHVVSLSTSDLIVTGTRAQVEFQVPLYEMPHVKEPAEALFANLQFSTAGTPARLIYKRCRNDESGGWFECRAEYDLAHAEEPVDVECTFHKVLVANHVHVLRAQRGEQRDQAVFDYALTRASLRFRPPNRMETAIQQVAGGVQRGVGGWAQWLFLLALGVAARSRKELWLLLGMFAVGQAVVTLVAPWLGWRPPAGFVEAALALTIAYLSVEVLVLPTAGQRWAVVAVLGGFYGLWLAQYIGQTGYRAEYVLPGALGPQLVLGVLLGLAVGWVCRAAERLQPVRVLSSLLLAFGLLWFVVRLRG
jgi:hypothetical protein